MASPSAWRRFALATSLSTAIASPYARSSEESQLKWAACPPEFGLHERIQCSTFSVPINWDEPEGDHFDLGLFKLPSTASDPSARLGTIMHHCGGPGAPGWFSMNAMALDNLPWEFEANNDLQARFDIVGIDPRGFGTSGQVECDMEIYAENPSVRPRTEEEYEKLKDWSHRFGQSCLNKTGPLLEFIDDLSVVKDYEAVRLALNDGPMNFHGISYGTQIGAKYASLYPENVRTMVLDAHVDDSLPETTSMILEGVAATLSLTHFFKWASSEEKSPLYGEDVESMYKSLLKTARESPLPASLCDGHSDCLQHVNDEDIAFFVSSKLLWKGFGPVALGGEWGTLAEVLHNATVKGDASGMSKRLDDPFTIAFLSIGCAEYPRETLQSWNLMNLRRIIADEYTPLTLGLGDFTREQLGCIGWPFGPRAPKQKYNITTEATILIAQSTRDPFGLMPHAVDMRWGIKNQALLVREGEGHTVFLHGGPAAKIITEYFITETAPEDGLIVETTS